MSHNLVVPVSEQQDLGDGYFLLGLDAPPIARDIRSGQFVMIGAPDIDAMLIRRPFSVALVEPAPGSGEPRTIKLLYKVVGRGTTAFSRLHRGDSIAVLGPLGRGFRLPQPGTGAELLLVAGGIGNAAFPLLVQEVGDAARERVTLFFGGRSRADLTLLDWFQARCRAVVTTTEDGSCGRRGLVTAPLLEHLEREPGRPRLVLACGPRPMLQAVSSLCLERQVPCQLAMEETMACGFGVCLGCVVPKRHPEGEFDRFVRVCTEGPVFDAEEIVP